VRRARSGPKAATSTSATTSSFAPVSPESKARVWPAFRLVDRASCSGLGASRGLSAHPAAPAPYRPPIPACSAPARPGSSATQPRRASQRRCRLARNAASSTESSSTMHASRALCAGALSSPKAAAAQRRSRPACHPLARERFVSQDNAPRASSAQSRRPTAWASCRGGVSRCGASARRAAMTLGFISTARPASNAEQARASRRASNVSSARPCR
jgi:hypothetical protein